MHDVARRRLSDLIQQQAAPAIMGVLPEDGRHGRLAVVVMQIAGLVLSRYVLEHSPVATLDRAELIVRVGVAVQRQLQ